MKATNVTSTLRSHGISIMNCTGNQTMYSSEKPFLFGKLKREAVKDSNGRYTVIKAGQFAGDRTQPYNIEVLGE